MFILEINTYLLNLKYEWMVESRDRRRRQTSRLGLFCNKIKNAYVLTKLFKCDIHEKQMTKGSGIEGKTELRRAGTQCRFICGSFAIEGKRANYVKQ